MKALEEHRVLRYGHCRALPAVRATPADMVPVAFPNIRSIGDPTVYASDQAHYDGAPASLWVWAARPVSPISGSRTRDLGAVEHMLSVGEHDAVDQEHLPLGALAEAPARSRRLNL